MSEPRLEGPLALTDVRDDDGREAVRVSVASGPREPFEALFDAPPDPELLPLARGDGWVILDPGAVTVARERLAQPFAQLSPAGRIKVTRQWMATASDDGSRGRLDREPPRAAIVIPSADLLALAPEQRSAAAGLAGLPLSTLDGLVAAGLPLVLESHRHPLDATRGASRIARDTGLPVVATTGPSFGTALWSGALGITALATGLATATVWLLGLWVLGVLGALLTLGLGAFAARAAAQWVAAATLLSSAREAEREANEERARRNAHPRLGRAWAALARVRVDIVAAQLPGPASSDLRGVLRAVEQELEALEATWRRTPNAAAVDAESRRIEEVLAELSRAVQRGSEDPEGEGLHALVLATRRARERSGDAL